MKIITSRNNKDFYDYLISIYGIDEKVVFDRRQYNVLKLSDSPFFCMERLPKDEKKEKKKYVVYDHIKERYVSRPIGKFMLGLLEVGLNWYIFRVERYLDDKERVSIDWECIKKIEIEKRFHAGVTAMTFFPDISWRKWYTPECIKKELKNGIENPILKGSKLTSFLAPDEVYQSIYAYLSSLNDFDFSDARSDIQKLESAGFDKVTSFRKIK